MRLHLKSQSEVRFFSVGVTIVALIGNVMLQYVILPPVLYHIVLFSSSTVTVILAAPISFFVGQRMRDIHELTVQLEHALNHDGLTGACTRANFYQLAETTKDQPRLVIVADIDHFKRVNDRHGHRAGDKALKQFTATLIRNCREDDIVARFGGEEFVILLRTEALEDGRATAQRLCDRVREKPLMLDGRKVHITASFGIARVAPTRGIDDAIHRADLALYRAKTSGRNRVCVDDASR